MRLIRILLAVVVTLLLGRMAGAVGLGAIEVNSYLNQPLDITIPLVSVDKSELADLEVGLAEAEDFSRIGLEPPMQSGALEFALASRNGRPVVHVTSERPVREPFISLLVRVAWAQGQLLREYTVLLDPPVTAPAGAPARPPVQSSPELEPEAVAQQEVITEEPQSVAQYEPEPVTEPQPVAEPQQSDTPREVASPPPGAQEYGPVGAGESLWSIAQATRPGAVSVNQMMLALLRANPQAFYEDNVNALRRGAVLRVPAPAQIEALTTQEVLTQIQRQHALWQDYRLRQSETIPTVIEGGDPAPRIAAEPQAPAESRLDLVPPRAPDESIDAGQAQAGAGIPDAEAEVAALRDELARTREELLARRSQTGELDSRVIELEQQVDRLQRLLELKNNELAALQARAGGQSLEPAAPSARTGAEIATADDESATTEETALADETSAPPDTADLNPFEDPLAAPADETTPLAEESVAEPLSAIEEETPPEQIQAPGAVEEAESQPATAEAPPPERETWYENLLSPMVVGIIGLALLAIGVALVLFRRRDAEAEYAGSTTLKRAALGDEQVGREAEAPVAAAETSEDAQPRPDEIEDDEAAFRARLAEHPEDTEARLALLTLYAAKNDRDAFISEAETLYAELADPSDPRWQQVRDMGEEVAPDHPLFKDLFAGEEDLQKTATDEFPSVDEAKSETTDEPAEPALFEEREPEAPAPAEAETEADTEPWLAADHEPALEDEPEPGEQSLPDREYDLEDLANEGDREEWNQPVPSDAEKNDLENDLKFAPPAGDSRETADEGRDDKRPSGESEFASESGEPDETEQATPVADEDDAAATKLELAEAYIEMGDEEGARGMLDEVLQDGSDAQQVEARKLLENIS